MNQAVLIGRLTKAPEARTAQTGNTVCTFTLAVDRPYVDKQTGKREADFIPIVTFKHSADYAHKYLDKGSLCAVVGSIQTRTYDAQDGTRRYVTEVLADRVEGLDRRKDAPAHGAPEPPGVVEADDDELPF